MLPAPYVVKNTFIHDSSSEGVPSSFLLDRQVQSCPLSRVPSMTGLALSSEDKQHQGFAGVMAAALEEHLNDFVEAAAADDSWHCGRPLEAEPQAMSGETHVVDVEFAATAASVEPSVDASSLATQPEEEIRSSPTNVSEAGPHKVCVPGSEGHSLGRCNPCAFLHTKGCTKGEDCRFCHLCTPGALKERKRQRRAAAAAAALVPPAKR